MLLAGEASAQEWYEAYRDGVKALAQGRADRAVSLLEYAVGRRPQPGRNVVTSPAEQGPGGPLRERG